MTTHYLENELHERLRHDLSIWNFVQKSSLDGLWYWDLENPENEWMSPEFWLTFGVDPASKLHKASEWQDMIHPDDLALAIENFQKHCADPNHAYDQEVRYTHVDGSTVWVRCRGMAVRDETGKPVRMLGAHNDITQLKRREAALVSEKAQVEQANEELRAFAYAVSHDLKSPSNTTMMLLNELKVGCYDTLDDDSRQLFDMTLASVERQRNLVEELLRYTRVIGEALHFERIDLNELVEKVIACLSADIEFAGGDIVVKRLPPIEGHRVQLQTLFRNLISNALKFRSTERRCSIHIQGSHAVNQGLITLSVSDNGQGIAEPYRERVFGMFQRLHNRSEVAGTGLGLALCKRIAINHKGSIVVDTPPDQPGSRITITLPARQHG